MNVRAILILAFSTVVQSVSADPIQQGHYSLYRQMEFSNICAIYEIWWPLAAKANEAKELDSHFIALLNQELLPNIGERFGDPTEFTESMYFYMSNRVQDGNKHNYSPIDCIAFQYHRSSKHMWDKGKIDKVILDDPDFWFGSAITQEKLAAALANETLLCFAAIGEWGSSCSTSERE